MVIGAIVNGNPVRKQKAPCSQGAFFNTEFGMNLTPIFNQYLRHTSIPNLEMRIKKGKLESRWKTDESKFAMPIDVKIKGKKIRIYPNTKWTSSKFKIKTLRDVEVLTNDYYITVN